MKLHELAKEFEYIVQAEEGTVTVDTELDSFADWDSLAIASLLVYFDERGIGLREADFKNVRKFGDIVNLVEQYIEK